MKTAGEQPPVAVLILNYNGMRFLPDCLASLAEYTSPLTHIYLIDNGSTDASVSWTKDRHPTVRIIENTQNLGFGPAYDPVIRELHEYKYLVLLNNDTVVKRDWLTTLIRTAEGDERIAACGSKILMMHNRSLIDHAGGLYTWIGAGLDIGKWTEDCGEASSEKETGFGCGASLLLRRTAYMGVGGFDTSYKMYHEDVDLCWRLRMAGYSVVHVPSSVVYHHGGGIIHQGTDRHPARTLYSQKNRLANILKNMPAELIPSALTISTMYDLIRIVRLVGLGRRNVVRAIFQGYLETFASLGGLLLKRRRFRSRKGVMDGRTKPFLASLRHSTIAYWSMVQSQRVTCKTGKNLSRH
ncbi:MAG: glycosyltransferase family 2 protein [Deltaproteobacteria bacterium]|nr:glycosyltransferase family 2 protein [Deltaproteobacteria bacterium]